MTDKLQKAGAWLWHNKERMVLIIMVVVFGYRVYMVFTPPPTPDWPPVRMPIADLPEDPEEQKTIGLPGDPPVRPPMDVPGAYAALYTSNPFWYYSGQQQAQQPQAAATIDVQLLDIQSAGGRTRARLRVGTRTEWVWENARFGEDYELRSVNAEEQTVEIYSERNTRTYVISK
ncbi:MAG: hypothetical protein GX580_16385 [Candidatus Hydrogenedens sp.]|nr:hypothetical protein [Candidatus Hydrogenedentota bacterium]NLF59209.1 hypothetical protein [Candidatus Hydrogenedens sp.]